MKFCQWLQFTKTACSWNITLYPRQFRIFCNKLIHIAHEKISTVFAMSMLIAVCMLTTSHVWVYTTSYWPTVHIAFWWRRHSFVLIKAVTPTAVTNRWVCFSLPLEICKADIKLFAPIPWCVCQNVCELCCNRIVCRLGYELICLLRLVFCLLQFLLRTT